MTADLANYPLDNAAPEDLAFFQYTSGSRAAPKSAMLTHGNISHDLSCIIRSLEAAGVTVLVSWLS